MMYDSSLMTYEEFKRQLGKAGMTAYEFADLTKMNRSSITNCSQRGVVPSHLAVIVALMGEMAENGINYRGVLGRIDIKSKRARGGATKGRFGNSRQVDLNLVTPAEK
jgi:hypothetical protein